MHNFSLYVYFYSLHVSGSYVPIIRRINCVNATPSICRIDTINSPDGGQIATRSIERIEVNI